MRNLKLIGINLPSKKNTCDLAYYYAHKEKLLARYKLWYLNNKKHADRNTKRYRQLNPEVYIFQSLKQRCINPKVRNYKNYGGRGIKCLLTSYKDIVNSIGKRPSKIYSIDRIDNDGHYSMTNIRWATWKQQAQNRRPRFSAKS